MAFFTARTPFLLTLFLMQSLWIFTQITPSLNWEITVGTSENESFNKLIETPDNQILAIGYQENNGQKEVLISKISRTGELLWQQTFGGSANEEAVTGIWTSEGNFFIAAWSESTDGDVSNPLAGKFIWVLNLDENGNLLWEKSFGGTNGDDLPTDIIQNQNNELLILGNSTSSNNDVPNNNGEKDIILLKINAEGDLLWSKNIGEENDEIAYDIDLLPNEEFILCGQKVHSDSLPTAPSLFYFLKTDADGNVLWEKTFGGSQPDIATNIEQKANGNLIALGHSCSLDGDLDANFGQFDNWILELDAEGNLISKKNFGGSKHDVSKDLEPILDGGFLITTASLSNDLDVENNKGNYDFWLFKLNHSNNEIDWQINLGGSESDQPADLISLENSTFAVGGFSQSADGDVAQSFGEKDAWLASVDLNCEYKNLPILGSRQEDSLALVDLFSAARGIFWFNKNNWLTAEPLETWHGIQTEMLCETGEFRVMEINLAENNLQDSLNTSLQNLYCAKTLDFAKNDLKALPILFTNTHWQNNPPPYLNVFQNELEYHHIVPNACIFYDSTQYWQQIKQPLSEIRRQGNASFAWVPFNETIDTASNFTTEYQWTFEDELVQDSTNRTLTLFPFNGDNDNGRYVRTATFSGSTTCSLAPVEIIYPIDLIIYNTNPPYLQNHFIVHYEEGTDEEDIINNNMELEGEGADLVKECPCGPKIQLWSVGEAVMLESIRQIARQKTGVDTTEYDYYYSHIQDKIFASTPAGSGFFVVQMVEDETHLDLQPFNNNLVKVAVIDSGVEDTHPMIQPYIWQNPNPVDSSNCLLNDIIGYDFRNQDGIPNDPENHGTPINGIIARDYPENELEIINGKFYETGIGDLFDAVCAMHYAMDEGAEILNLSWGYYEDSSSFILEEAIQRAADENVLIITSSGNDGQNAHPPLGANLDIVGKWPANFSKDFDNIIVVGAYHETDDENIPDTLIYPQYANFGDSTVHLAAPGRIRAPSINGGTAVFSGTSIATPHITRAAAVAKGTCPNIPNSTIKSCLLSTVTIIPEFEDLLISSGIFNTEDFTQCILDSCQIVNLIVLNGYWNPQQGIELNWHTLQNYEDRPFIIWKSQDQQNWEELAQKTPQAARISETQFATLDKNPNTGSNFYKIENSLPNGEIISSEIIEIEIPKVEKGSIEVFPNPVTQNQISINTNFESKDKLLEIRDLSGQLIFSENSKQDILQINLPEMKAGLYLIRVSTNDGFAVKKLMVH